MKWAIKLLILLLLVLALFGLATPLQCWLYQNGQGFTPEPGVSDALKD
jgi:hypothetical protein